MALDKRTKPREIHTTKYPHFPMERRNALKGLVVRSPFSADKRQTWAWGEKYAAIGAEASDVNPSEVCFHTGYEFTWPMSTNETAKYVALNAPPPEEQHDEYPYRDLAPDIPIVDADGNVIDLVSPTAATIPDVPAITDSSSPSSSNGSASVTSASSQSTNITTPSSASVQSSGGANFAGAANYAVQDPTNVGTTNAAGANDVGMADFNFDIDAMDIDNIPLYPLHPEQGATNATASYNPSTPLKAFAGPPGMPYGNAQGIMPEFPPFPLGNFPAMPGMPAFSPGNFPGMPGMLPQFTFPPNSAPVSPRASQMYNPYVNMTPLAQAAAPVSPPTNQAYNMPMNMLPFNQAATPVPAMPTNNSFDIQAAIQAATQLYMTLNPNMPATQATTEACKMVMSNMTAVQTPNRSPQMTTNANMPPLNQFSSPMGQVNGPMFTTPPSNNVSPHMYPAAGFNGQMNNGSSPFMNSSHGVGAQFYTGSPNGPSAIFSTLLTSADFIAGPVYQNGAASGQFNPHMPFAPAGNFAEQMNPAQVFGGQGNTQAPLAHANNSNNAIHHGRAVNNQANMSNPSNAARSSNHRHAASGAAHVRANSNGSSPVHSNKPHPAAARATHNRTKSSPTLNNRVAGRVQSPPPRSVFASKPVRVTKPPVNKNARSTITYGANSSPQQAAAHAQALARAEAHAKEQARVKAQAQQVQQAEAEAKVKAQAAAQAQARARAHAHAKAQAAAKAQAQIGTAAKRLDSHPLSQNAYNPTPVNKPNVVRQATNVARPDWVQSMRPNANNNGRTLGHMNVSQNNAVVMQSNGAE